MFDEVFGMVERCSGTFREIVRDAFGASLIADVLDPIRNEIGMLRSFHVESQGLFLDVAQVLDEARSITLPEDSER